MIVAYLIPSFLYFRASSSKGGKYNSPLPAAAPQNPSLPQTPHFPAPSPLLKRSCLSDLSCVQLCPCC